MGKKRFMAVLIFMLMALSLITGCVSAPAYQFRPGEYTGEGQGYGGTIVMRVEVDGSRIVSITVAEHRETQVIATPAFNRIPAQIIEKQSLAVDMVAGATATGNGIIAGVRAALISAGATEEQLMGQGRNR